MKSNNNKNTNKLHLKKKKESWYYSIMNTPWSKVSVLGFLIVSILIIIVSKFLEKKNEDIDSSANVNIGNVVGNENSVINNIHINQYKNTLPDSINCSAGEKWCGMTQPKVDDSGEIFNKNDNIIFYGAIRWSPIIEGEKQTSEGAVFIYAGNKEELIYSWQNPNKVVHEFKRRVKILKGYKGKYFIRWKYLNGTSGFCITTSEIN